MTSTATNSEENVERRCEKADCLVGELVMRIPKRKTPQFIVNPTIIEKPLIVNNFNSVFQVDGSSAKLSDINPDKNENDNETVPKTIYRIIPNTHAHIVNYVVVEDSNTETLRKWNNIDPLTMNRLLKSQVTSAQKMLNKLMSEQGTMVNISYNNRTSNDVTAKSTTTSSTTTITSTTTTSSSATTTSSSSTTTSSTTTTIPTATKNSTKDLVNEINASNKHNNIKTTNITELTKPMSTVETTSTNINSQQSLSKSTNLLSTSSLTVSKLSTRTTTTTSTPKLITLKPTTTTATMSDLHKSLRINSQIQVTRKSLAVTATATPTTTTKTNSTITTTKTLNNKTTTPFIKTVPLSQLQKPSVLQNRPFTTTVKPLRSLMSTSLLNTTSTGFSEKSPDLVPSTSPLSTSPTSLFSEFPLLTTPPTITRSTISLKAATAPKTTAATKPSTPLDDSISMEAMKKELADLRQTVAALAANHAKIVSGHTATDSTTTKTATETTTTAPTSQPRAKRARLGK